MRALLGVSENEELFDQKLVKDTFFAQFLVTMRHVGLSLKTMYKSSGFQIVLCPDIEAVQWGMP